MYIYILIPSLAMTTMCIFLYSVNIKKVVKSGGKVGKSGEKLLKVMKSDEKWIKVDKSG